MTPPAVMVASMIGWIVVCRTLSSICRTMSPPRWIRPRAIAYEKFGRWFDAEEPLLRAKERTDAGSSPFRHPRSELIAPLLQEAPPAFNNRKLHMRLPCHLSRCSDFQRQLSTPSSEKVAQRVIGGGAVSLATYTTYCLRIV